MELPGGKDYVIIDSRGKQYAVDQKGNINGLGQQAKGGKPAPENTNGVNKKGLAENITAQGVVVTFTKTSDSKYGFDAYNAKYPATKELYEKLSDGYYLPYKAVKNGDEDYILATINISDKSIVADSLIFKTKDGTAIEVADKRGNQWKLKVKGYQNDAIKQVLATIKQGEKYQVAGAFNLYHLSEKTVDVVLVNTNNANKKAIEQKLDEVYRQAVVKVNIVQEIRDFNLNAPGGTIESGQSGFAANYTRQQQAINRALRNRSDYKPSAYYLITTDLRPSSTGEKGLMPLGRQFGYIYGKDARTLAHELAHGAFKLKHSFSGKSYAFTPGSTDWLTDYSGGVRIPFVQWQEIHNPTLRIGLFDKDEEGKDVEDPVREEDLINYDVLVKWIKANYGKKSVAYNPEEFIVPSKLVYFRKLDKVKQLAYSVPFTTPEGRKLKLEGSLSLEKGRVDLSTIYLLLELETNKKHRYTDIIKYAKDKSYKETDAIRITIEDVKDYEAYTAFTGLDFNKGYVLEKYNDEFAKATRDCNKIDFLYEHAPAFVLASRTDSLWSDLKIIASCSVDQWGTDEELVVLKLLEAIGSNKGAEVLLAGLLKEKVNNEALFKVLYEKLHNYGGEDNFTKYIYLLYKYWVVSPYNNFERFSYQQASDIIPYKSTKTIGFYFDAYNFSFEGANYIKVAREENQQTENWVYSTTLDLGKYELYQPIHVVDISQKGEIKLPNKNLPIFYLKAFDDINSAANFETGVGLTFDVVTTFSGVGNLTKLSHLRHLTKLNKLKVVIGTVEVSAASASLMLRYSDNCGEKVFCQKLTTYLFWLEMMSLSADAITQRMLKKSAREALAVADNRVDIRVKKELAKFAGVEGRVSKYGQRLDEIGEVLENGLVKGKHSGRTFDPNKAGGAIKNLKWTDAIFDDTKINIVKKHLGRLEYDPWNVAMIKRLEDIKAGKIKATDYDKRFITHETTEFKRYKELGYENTHYTEIPVEVWDNTHTATLEDFTLKDYKIKTDGGRDYLLYHPDVQKIPD